MKKIYFKNNNFVSSSITKLFTLCLLVLINPTSVANNAVSSLTDTNFTAITNITLHSSEKNNPSAIAAPGDEVSYGTDSWIGYVYASTNGGNPPSNAFTTSYVGYVNRDTKFDQDLGSGSITGTNLTSSYSDYFAIRYKMNKSMPAGNYTFTVGGDDGYRLSLDGGSSYVVNVWNNHAYSSRTYTVYLSGSTNFVLEYFETAGLSRVSFDYTYCPTSAGTLSGDQYICRYSPNNTTTFSSTVPEGTWSSSNTAVATVNSTTGVVTGLTNGTATISYKTSTSCTSSYTSTRVVYVANSPGAGPTSLSGSTSQCVNSTTTYTITADPYSYAYIWSYQGTGATITPAADGLSASVTFSTTATSGNMRVQSTNACGTDNGGKYLYVTIVQAPGSPSTGSPDSATCTGFTARWNTASNATSYSIDVATDSGFTNIVSGYNNYNAGNNLALVLTGLSAGTTYYYRVRAIGTCGTSANSTTMTYTTSASPASTPVITSPTNSNCTNGLQLNWTQVTSATGYYVDISTSSTFSSFVSGFNNYQVGYQTNNVYVSGLTSGVVYYYRVRAYTACSTTASSNIISFSLGSVGGTVSSAQTICSGTAASDLTLSGYTGTILRWEKSSDFSFTSPITISNTSATLSSAAIGTLASTTYFRAVVQNGTCSTANSNSAKITIKTPVPNDPSTNSVVCDGFTVLFNGNESGNEYYLEVATTSSFTAGTFATGYPMNVGTNNKPTVTGLTPNTTYYLRVRGMSTTGTPSCTSAYSGTSSVTTSAGTAAPVQNSTSSSSCDGFQVNWNLSGSGTYTATAYYLDIATTSTFDAGTIVRNNVSIGTSRIYTVTGLTGGTYYTRITASGPCGTSTYSGTQTGTVFSTTTPTISAVTQPSCTTTNGTLTITNYSTGNTYTVTPSTGVVMNAGSISAPTGSYTLTATNIVSPYCTSLPVSFTVNAQLAKEVTPTLGTTVQPTCLVPTGKVTLNSLPSTGTWTITQSGTVSATYTGTGTSKLIDNLAAGTYTFTVSATAACPSLSSATLKITAIETKTWNGTGWSGPVTGSTEPTIENNLLFTGNYTVDTNVTGCSCTVNNGASVTMLADKVMKIYNQVQVETGGSITFKDRSSLVQINDAAVNSGSITYIRYTTQITNFDYTYWSSPVIGQKLSVLSPDTFYDKYYSLNAAANSWTLENRDNLMTVGKGYIIRGPEYYKAPAVPGLFDGTFFGVPNNGVIKVTIGGAGTTNLIGNPYASAIDADTFIAKNSSSIEGTLYFWTHNTAIQLASNITNGTAGSGVLAYTSDDYASYNSTGGTATARSTTGSSAGVIPTGKIAAGQGFMAIGKSTVDAEFNNSMRLDGVSGTTLVNSQFFKTTSSAKATAKTAAITLIEKNRLWLNLANTQGAFKQILIGYVTGATNDYESAYDGVTFNANSYVNFYSINNKFPFSIQGRAIATQEYDNVPLGYSSKIEGDFTIGIDSTDGIISNQIVYLEDKLLGINHNLTEQAYSFTTAVGTFDDRFVITYKAKTTLSVDNPEITEKNNEVYVTQKENLIDIHSQSELITEISMYDITGKLVTYKTKVNSQDISLSKIANSVQVFILRIKLENGEIVNKKFVQQYN
ncbi:hypothetical protein [Flavobacterium algicola]|uniref:hypothetical protein n=1 Tax=Flavobacterium algicola TaxID=556529 RepID=UPI001EFC6689|nr:hypothetical protein [Flavobacterium algicola]MCG9791756.1 hypothetical protein [Flavobacterium algicola]